MGEDFSDFWNHGAIHGNLYVTLWISVQWSVGDALILWSCLVDKCYHGLTSKFSSSWSHLTFYLGELQKNLPGEEVVENFEDDDELPTII